MVQHKSDTKYDEQENDVKEQFGFPTTQATAVWRERAAWILKGKISFSGLKQFIEACFELAKEWFKKHCRFLM